MSTSGCNKTNHLGIFFLVSPHNLDGATVHSYYFKGWRRGGVTVPIAPLYPIPANHNLLNILGVLRLRWKKYSWTNMALSEIPGWSVHFCPPVWTQVIVWSTSLTSSRTGNYDLDENINNACNSLSTATNPSVHNGRPQLPVITLAHISASEHLSSRFYRTSNFSLS